MTWQNDDDFVFIIMYQYCSHLCYITITLTIQLHFINIWFSFIFFYEELKFNFIKQLLSSYSLFFIFIVNAFNESTHTSIINNIKFVNMKLNYFWIELSWLWILSILMCTLHFLILLLLGVKYMFVVQCVQYTYSITYFYSCYLLWVTLRKFNI